MGVGELEGLKGWVRDLSPRRVLIQAPPGLIDVAREVSSLLEGMGVEVVFSGGMCWGGCDLALREAAELGCDAIVHKDMPSSSDPILFRCSIWSTGTRTTSLLRLCFRRY